MGLWGNRMKKENLLCLVGSEIEKGEKGSSGRSGDLKQDNCESHTHGLQTLGMAFSKSCQCADLQPQSEPMSTLGSASLACNPQGAVSMKECIHSKVKRGTVFSE